MRTLNGLGGAACSPAQAIAPTPASACADAPGHLARPAQGGPDAAGDLGRARWRAPAARRRAAGRRWAAAAGSSRARAAATGIGSGEVSNSTVAMSTPGDAVDERVMGLGEHREAVLGQPLDQPQLPQRPGAVEGLREDASGQPLELLLAAGARQRGVAHVEADVEVGVVDPHRAALVERHEGQPLAVARDEVQAGRRSAPPTRRSRCVAVEHHAAGHVHVGRVALQVQERAVQAGQAVRVGHAADSCRPPWQRCAPRPTADRPRKHLT